MPSDGRGIGARFHTLARRYSARDLIAITGIWMRLAFVDMRLKILPPHIKRIWLYGLGSIGHAPLDPTLRAEALRLERLVVVASGHPIFFNMSCLRRALTLRSLFDARKIPSRLVFGVRRSAERGVPEAHAWLELGELKLGLGAVPSGSGFVAFRPVKKRDSVHAKA
ncbi:MAG: lasso peptide biosynthesis B2 protein [Rectinemataceae bacterium]